MSVSFLLSIRSERSPSTSIQDEESRWEQGLALVLGLILLTRLILPFLSERSWSTLLQDDAFYYLEIAKNIVAGRGSTFNGITETNGYQPLWLLWITMWTSLSPVWGPLIGIVIAILCGFFVIFSVTTHYCSRAGIRPITRVAIASWAIAICADLFYDGMETIVTVPGIFLLGLLLSDRHSYNRKSAFLTGGLASIVLLSRLDALLFIFTLFVFLAIARRRKLIQHKEGLLWLGMGLLPVAGYLVSNKVHFGAWLPISATAKHLKIGLWPAAITFTSLYHLLPWWKTAGLIVAVVILILGARDRDAIRTCLVLATLVFPMCYYFLLSCLSDWRLWTWYLYPLVLITLLGLVVAAETCRIAVLLERPWVTTFLIVTAFFYLGFHSWPRKQGDIEDAAIRVSEFSLTHPGIYAMGDRAGRVGYALRYPLIQLEGLVMDDSFVSRIREEQSLKAVLAQYHVRYYIATGFPTKTCFHAKEPLNAGVESPVMRSDFCAAPVAVFPEGPKQTMIFDVDPR